MKKTSPPLWKPLVDFGPIAVFFTAYFLFGLMPATAAFVVATLIALGAGWSYERRVEPMPLISAVVVLLMGGLTLALNDERFIKLKPTIVFALFSTVLLGGLAVRRPLLRPLLRAMWELDEAGWRKLSLRFGLFFAAMAALNEIVWRGFSTDVWVTFKLFGFLPLTVLFTALQVPLIRRHGVPCAPSPTDAD